jgi:hypothetical protein
MFEEKKGMNKRLHSCPFNPRPSVLMQFTVIIAYLIKILSK